MYFCMFVHTSVCYYVYLFVYVCMSQPGPESLRAGPPSGYRVTLSSFCIDGMLMLLLLLPCHRLTYTFLTPTRLDSNTQQTTCSVLTHITLLLFYHTWVEHVLVISP